MLMVRARSAGSTASRTLSWSAERRKQLRAALTLGRSPWPPPITWNDAGPKWRC